MPANLRSPVSLEPATEEDIPFLSALARDPDVEPFLMIGAGDEAALRALLLERRLESDAHGLFVIQSPAGERLGGLTLRVSNRRSRICDLSRLMVRPDRRRAGIAAAAVSLASRRALVEDGLHRIQAEVYGHNPASQALFERAGFVCEGIRRSAYWREGRWVDGVLFGLLAEEFASQEAPPAAPGQTGG